MRSWWVVVLVACAHPPPPIAPPPARTDSTVDHVLGIDVADPYRWMETNADERDTWLRAQGAYAAKVIAQLPDRRALSKRVAYLASRSSASWRLQFEHGRFIYALRAYGSRVTTLATRDRSGAERVLVDPSRLGTPTEHAQLGGYSLSPDGLFVCYAILRGDDLRGELYVLDVATGNNLTDVVHAVASTLHPCRWLPDSKRFFYTLPTAAGDPRIDYIERLHVLGQRADRDVTLIDHAADGVLKLAPEERPDLTAAPDSWVIAGISDARSDFRVAVARSAELDLTGGGATPWRIVADYPDGVSSAFIHGDRLYLMTFADAPNGKLVSVPLEDPDLAHARVDIAEDPNALLVDIDDAADAVYVVRGANGRARLSRWAWSGAETPIALPADGWVSDLTTAPNADGLVFRIDTWLRPTAYYTYNPATARVTQVGFGPNAYYAYDPATAHVTPVGFGAAAIASPNTIAVDDVEVSSGGVKVPLTIIHQKSAELDGSNPTLIYAYGAYGSIETPTFNATRLAWLERGGVIAIAHVRGGGEKGRRWQDGGARDHKLDGVRDLIACADYLVAHKWTASSRLGVAGNGLGGILVGRAITLRPELFAAATIGAGFVNPSRLAMSDGGAAQKGELGDPATESGLRALLDMDPYEHVTPHTAYPAVLFAVDMNDHSVSPWQTAKLAARLQAATTSGRPILVEVDPDPGNVGWSRSRSRVDSVDVWSFMLSQFR